MMKKKLILSFFFVALGFGVVKAQDLPDKKETLKTVTKVNDYFMKKYADYRTPSFVKNVTRPSNIWTRGVYYEGLMALYSVYPRDDYYKYAVDWSNYHEWGFRNGTTTRNADDYCASQTYIDLYNICPDPERIRKVKANIDMLVNTPQVNDWWWIDAIQMGMPVFAKLGKLNRRTKIFRTKCGICMNIPVTNMVKMACTTKKKVCGGETKTLIPLTKNLTVRIAIGVVVMDGICSTGNVYWMKFLLMKNIAPTISMIS